MIGLSRFSDGEIRILQEKLILDDNIYNWKP